MNNENVLNEIIEITGQSSTNSVRVFFITREIMRKPQTTAEKYKYNLYTIDVSDEIRKLLLSANEDQLNHRVKKEYKLVDYDLIMDDEKSIYTYKVDNLVSGFKESIYNRIDAFDLKSFPGLELLSIITKEDLWAYVVEIKLDDNSKYYVLRKITRGHIASDDDKPHNKRLVRTKYDVTDKKLELVQGETINLEKQIDCILYQNTFFIFRKEKFEQMVGLDDAYEKKAVEVVKNVENANVIEGIVFLEELLQSGSVHHKRLIKIEKVGIYRNLTPEIITKMQETARKWKVKLVVSDNRIVISSKEEAETVIKFLVDYHKVSPVTGFRYGTFSGDPIKD